MLIFTDLCHSETEMIKSLFTTSSGNLNEPKYILWYICSLKSLSHWIHACILTPSHVSMLVNMFEPMSALIHDRDTIESVCELCDSLIAHRDAQESNINEFFIRSNVGMHVNNDDFELLDNIAISLSNIILKCTSTISTIISMVEQENDEISHLLTRLVTTCAKLLKGCIYEQRHQHILQCLLLMARRRHIQSSGLALEVCQINFFIYEYMHIYMYISTNI